MRLEKREITLNEHDSLLDIAFMEKALLGAYVEGLAKVRRKEARERLLGSMRCVAEDLFLVKDLLEKVKEQSGN